MPDIQTLIDELDVWKKEGWPAGDLEDRIEDKRRIRVLEEQYAAAVAERDQAIHLRDEIERINSTKHFICYDTLIAVFTEIRKKEYDEGLLAENERPLMHRTVSRHVRTYHAVFATPRPIETLNDLYEPEELRIAPVDIYLPPLFFDTEEDAWKFLRLAPEWYVFAPNDVLFTHHRDISGEYVMIFCFPK